MSESFRLGRIAGIRIGINLSVLVIVAIVAGSLALGRFPATYPGRHFLAYAAAGLAAAVLFLASILAHEIAHAVVARRNGVEVEGITLWLLGGVAQLRGEPRSPGADFRIAAVGPATSVVLSLAFGLVALLSFALGLELPTAVLGYLAGTNLVLALFNLVPAAPLDGGRVLRAFLWRRSRDRVKAATTAARAGRWFGYLLIAYGALQVFSGGGLAGLWSGLLGLFLVNAATAEEQQARLGRALDGLRVAEVMSPQPVVADGRLTVEQFLHEVLLTSRFSTYPLVDPSGRLVGLVTLNRVRSVPPERRARTLLQEIACPLADIPLADPREPLVDLLPRMSGCTDGRAVVVADGTVVGLVSPSDVSRAVQLADLRRFDGYRAPTRGADLSSGSFPRR